MPGVEERCTDGGLDVIERLAATSQIYNTLRSHKVTEQREVSDPVSDPEKDRGMLRGTFIFYSSSLTIMFNEIIQALYR